MSHLAIKIIRLILISAILAAPAFAQDINVPAIDAIVIEGRAENLVGRAGSANEGYIGQAELSRRPLSRVGEVVEAIPGVIVSQHSGGGKANQFYLRGFNLDHGTDLATSLDGMPVNMPTTRTVRVTRISIFSSRNSSRMCSGGRVCITRTPAISRRRARSTFAILTRCQTGSRARRSALSAMCGR